MSLLLYLPENDLALANGLAQYTPPPAAWQLHMAGEALPLWYGEPGDAIFSYGINNEWLGRMQHDFGIEVDVWQPGCEAHAEPWGWSAYGRKFLRDNCPGTGPLPDDGRLLRLRALSHRRTASLINEYIRQNIDYPWPSPAREITTPEVLQPILASGRHYLKQPWSSSGRGNIDTLGQTPEEVLRQATGVIRRQGSVMVEEYLDGVADFAALFESRGGKVRHRGWSWFDTVRMGEYAGNLIAPQGVIAGRITSLINSRLLDSTVGVLEQALTTLAGADYEGFLGIDMMAYRHGGEVRLAPCLEMNLRMTMGVVAWRMAERFLAPGVLARLSVVAVGPKTDLDALSDYTVCDGRLVGGSLLLSPPSQRFAVTATVI